MDEREKMRPRPGAFFYSSFFLICAYTARQITVDTAEPMGAARPMGKSEAYLREAMYASGILAVTMEAQLWINDTPERTQAQK